MSQLSDYYGKLKRRHLERAGIEDLSFSPDGKLVATAGRDSAIFVWDVAAKTKSRELAGHSARVYATQFAPDGKWLASAGKDGVVLIWDTATYQVIERIPVGQSIHSLAYSPDGRWLAYPGAGNKLMLRELGLDRTLSLDGHHGLITDIRWSADGQNIVSTSQDHSIRVWNVQRPEQVKKIDSPLGMVWRAAFAPDGKTIYSAHGGKALVQRSLETGKPIALFQGGVPKFLV